MPDIRHSIRIDASLVRVRGLVSEAGGLREWWAEDVEEQADGNVTLGFFSRTTIYRLRPLENSVARVAWRCESGQEWQGTDLVFKARVDGTATMLDFEHLNWLSATPYFVSCNTTWGGLMFRIRAAAEGQHPGPLFGRTSLGY
jgi:hypothetical protein